MPDIELFQYDSDDVPVVLFDNGSPVNLAGSDVNFVMTQDQLGTTDSTGKREVTREQVIDYITVNAAEIAGFAQTSKITYIN